MPKQKATTATTEPAHVTAPLSWETLRIRHVISKIFSRIDCEVGETLETVAVRVS